VGINNIEERCPPGGHLVFWAALVFEMNLPLVKPNPQKITLIRQRVTYSYLTETKFKMAAIAAILDERHCWFSKVTFL
jgi:hypothetical protein